MEFTIDPAKLKPELTTDSKDAAIKKRVLLEGKWSVRARIAKDPQEAYPYAVHLRTRTDINVVQKKIRILLVGDAPGREFTFLRTMLVREVQDQRATLTTYVQNDAGKNRLLTPEKDEQLLDRFPDRFDISSNKALANEEDRKLNLNEYDLIIAFDPDWSELTEQQAGDLSRPGDRRRRRVHLRGRHGQQLPDCALNCLTANSRSCWTFCRSYRPTSSRVRS